MKNLIPLILLLLSLSKVSIAVSNQQIKYRIQCATSADKDLMDKLSDVPELKSFTLPTGTKIYFSGGYFNKITIAEERLAEVQSAGFKSAFIIVFKYNNMLSKPLGDQYILNAKKKVLIYEAAEKEEKKNIIAVKKEESKGPRLYSRAEIDAMKKKVAERKAKEIAAQPKVEKKEVVIEEKEVVIEQKEKVEKKKKAAFVVDEPPVFKIMLGRVKSKNDPFEAVSKLNNEIVYTYEDRNEIIYAVGFYGNKVAAEKALPKYKKHTVDAEIIGLYKGKVISLKLANELYEQFNENNN